jgi:hypothetical protein
LPAHVFEKCETDFFYAKYILLLHRLNEYIMHGTEPNKKKILLMGYRREFIVVHSRDILSRALSDDDAVAPELGRL